MKKKHSVVSITNKVAVVLFIAVFVFTALVSPDLSARADGLTTIGYDAYMQTYGWTGWVGGYSG